MVKKFLSLPYLPIFLAPIILFSPLLFTGKVLFWGTPALQFVPWWTWAWETLLDGHLPLWNPYVGMGAPLMANYQSALFYPPYWVYFFFYGLAGIKAMAWAQGLLVTLHLIWAGLGMALLVRQMKYGRLAQTVAGLAFSLSGYLVARSWFASINASVAWLPWVVLMSHNAAEQPHNFRHWVKLSLVLAFQLLSGHAQTTWYTMLLAGIWVGFRAFILSTQGKVLGKLKTFLFHEMKYGLAVLAGVALAAVQLFPTFVYLQQSQRASAVEMEFALNYSFWPWRILGLVAPGFFGSPVRGDFWGYGNYWEDALYIGLLPILLALAAILRTPIQRWSQRTVSGELPFIRILVLTIVLSFLMALGKNTPIFPWLYRFVPTFDMFQAPTRISIWAVFCLSILAAMRADAWRRPTGQALYWTRLATAGAFAISLGAGLAFWGMGDVKATFIRAAAMAGLWGVGSGLLALAAPEAGQKHRQNQVWQWMVIAWICLDLIVAGWGLVPGISADFYARNDFQHPQINGRVYLSPSVEDEIKYEHFLSFESFHSDVAWYEMRAALLPNLNMLEEIASTNNFDPMLPGRYVVWMESLEAADEAKRKVLLQLMGVEMIETLAAPKQFDVRYDSFEGGSRVRWVPCAIAVKDQAEAWERVFGASFDPGIEVIVETLNPAQLQNCPWTSGEAKVINETPNQVVINVEANASGWLVLSDVMYPGWSAFVDGQKTSIWQANYLFRAISIEEGVHQVIFAYRPLEFYAGAVISLVSWLIALVILFKKTTV